MGQANAVCLTSIEGSFLVFMNEVMFGYSKQQPKRQSENTANAQTSLSGQPWTEELVYAQVEPKNQPVYAQVKPKNQPASGNGEIYANETLDDDFQTPETVIYSQLQSRDTAADVVTPSDESLYANAT